MLHNKRSGQCNATCLQPCVAVWLLNLLLIGWRPCRLLKTCGQGTVVADVSWRHSTNSWAAEAGRRISRVSQHLGPAGSGWVAELRAAVRCFVDVTAGLRQLALLHRYVLQVAGCAVVYCLARVHPAPSLPMSAAFNITHGHQRPTLTMSGSGSLAKAVGCCIRYGSPAKQLAVASAC
jgi:hypothetical protein